MTELEGVANDLKLSWLAYGLKVTRVTSDDLERLRTAFVEPLPTEYETFLRIAGLPSDDDRNHFRMWSPREVCTTHDTLVEAKLPCAAGATSIIICDYLQESWWYALWLSGPFRGSVSCVGGYVDDPPPPFGTFIDFLKKSLRDDASIYPSSAVRS